MGEVTGGVSRLSSASAYGGTSQVLTTLTTADVSEQGEVGGR